MKKKADFWYLFRSSAFVLIAYCSCLGQGNQWLDFHPLETTRETVEKLLGPPQTIFPTFGRYENDQGRFLIWYSSGNCCNTATRREWKVAKGTLTKVVFYPTQLLPISSYKERFKEFESLSQIEGKTRNLYVSTDNTVVFETIRQPSDWTNERVYSITLDPGAPGSKLLCEKLK